MDEYVDIYNENRELCGESILRKATKLQDGQYIYYSLAIIQDMQGRFLITQRSLDKSWAAGAWEISGGGVLAGETPYEAVVREVREEVGLDISGLEPKSVYTYTNTDIEHNSNYHTNIYLFQLDFADTDVTIAQSEAIAFKLATWEEIANLHEKDGFLHFARIETALEQAAQVTD